MKLQQLKFLIEIDKQDLNISRAAEVLCTSQSGISKQVSLLEAELEIDIFSRHGRKLTGKTPAGEQVLALSQEILDKVEDIKKTAGEFTEKAKSIAIATTHTQARYVLPVIVERFLSLYPGINLNIQQGTPEQVASLLEQGEVDIAIATEVLASREALIALPCYQWSRNIILKKNHPLVKQVNISLNDIAKYPIITYVSGFTARYKQDEMFNKQGLKPNIVLTAVDADVIKTYVRLGLGIGIIADMAFNADQDSDLTAIKVEHLFGRSTSQVAIKRNSYLKHYAYSFIELIAPHLTPELIVQASSCLTLEARQALIAEVSVPVYRD